MKVILTENVKSLRKRVGEIVNVSEGTCKKLLSP
jgi:ribosomal protein L9